MPGWLPHHMYISRWGGPKNYNRSWALRGQRIHSPGEKLHGSYVLTRGSARAAARPEPRQCGLLVVALPTCADSPLGLRGASNGPYPRLHLPPNEETVVRCSHLCSFPSLSPSSPCTFWSPACVHRSRVSLRLLVEVCKSFGFCSISGGHSMPPSSASLLLSSHRSKPSSLDAVSSTNEMCPL